MRLDAFACFILACGAVYCCNPDWYLYKQKCYRSVKFACDMRMARRYCQIYGGDLATVQDRDTLNALVSSVLQNTTDSYWLDEKSAINQNTSSIYCSFTYYDDDIGKREIGVDGDCSEKAFFICEVSEAEGELGCPKSWSLYGGICYKAMTTKATYSQAASFCSVQRAKLAVLDDIGKEHNAAAVIIGSKEAFLVGSKLESENGVYKWSTGSDFQPSCSECRNNTPGECIGFASDPQHPTMFTWVNLNCSAANNFLCEMAPVVLSTTPTTTEPTTTPRPLQCPVGYNWKAHEESGFCFWETTYETDRLNWFQARQFCQGYGGDLATYQDTEQENHGLGGAKGHYRGLWFGLRRDENDVFRWVDGTTPNYTNWNTNEPKLESRTKYCVVHGSSYSKWELDYCGVKRWFICKAPKKRDPQRVDSYLFKKTNCNFTGPSIYNDKWFLKGDQCYLVHEEAKYSWKTAQYFCQDNGGHLASVHSFEETNFILQLTSSSPNMDFWIGLSAQGIDASLTWSDGTPLDFIYWEDDYNATQILDSCIVFDKQRGFWTIDHCNRFLGVICKRGVNASYDFTTPEPTPTLPGNCQRGWYRLGNKCYWIDGKKYSQRSTWTDASDSCKNLGAALVSIHSQEEQEFLTDILLETGFTAWIGLENLNRGSIFKWADDTPLDYTNWNINEPDLTISDMSIVEARSKSQLCVELDNTMSTIGKWNDVPCYQQKSYICEKNVDPALTEPSQDPFVCPNISSWLKLGTSCYGIFEKPSEQLPWLEAQAKCRTYGANLITLKYPAVSMFMKRKLSNQESFYWIGRRETRDNTYEKVTMSKSQFSNWHSGQPTRISEKENCVAMYGDSKWFVRNCLEKHYFVCELDNDPEQGIPDTVTIDNTECPSGWEDFGGENCYYFETRPITWNNAMLDCYKKGGHLASFHSMEELERVRNFVMAQPSIDNLDFYIGLGKRSDGSYSWVDHSPVDFVNWLDPERTSSKECVRMNVRNLKWSPVDCNRLWEGHICAVTKNKEEVKEYKTKKSKSQQEEEEKVISHKISTGAIVGIVVLVLIILAIIGGIIYHKYPMSSVKPQLLEPENL